MTWKKFLSPNHEKNLIKFNEKSYIFSWYWLFFHNFPWLKFSLMRISLFKEIFYRKTDLKKISKFKSSNSYEISLISQLEKMWKSYQISCKHHEYFSWQIGINQLRNGSKIMIFRDVLNFKIITFSVIYHAFIRNINHEIKVLN